MAGEKEKRRKRRQKGKPEDPVQSARFIDAARALGADESEEAFHRAFRALLKIKPKPKR